ncbi:GntR family transcriptional regulator [Nordella sp. HKS 07]|uniref:GntR family transcriptional regulator n=1 Tax=Nordella sp. HKS 07 TaxID=2712222 RepID=UPI0013E167AD|nr:GntR family transcriptional regulator [Nordella sp. HKS 07]QIG47650.1 GntR family transcriptional regulator [Nordella sp. HKS 07]
MTAAPQLFARARIAAGGSAPLYLKLKRLVTDAIAQGELADRDAIPGERDLARMLGISRVTVRKAFADLVAEGVLVQRRGSGTFVAPREERIELPLSRLTSFTEDMRLRGLDTRSDWLERSIALPTPEEALVLALSPGEKVSRLHRLRLAEDKPLAIERATIPHRFLPDPLAVETSLYETLIERGLRPVRALQRLHAAALGKGDGDLLGLAEGSPALFTERVAYLADGRVVEFTRSHYRGDSYDFVAELHLAEGS